jgi:hypothetical protein
METVPDFVWLRGMGWNEYGSRHRLSRKGEVTLPPAFAYVEISAITHLHFHRYFVSIQQQ